MKEILYLCSVFIKLVYRMDAKKILFIAQEITPYLPESEIATICRNLPQGIQERGREIRTFMPKFGSINERRNQLHEVIRLSGMNLIIDDTDHPLIIKVASIQAARMQVYFIDNEDFFQRKHTISDDDGNEYEDNDDRSIFYVRGVLETVKKLRWCPDVIHCHGWMSAMVPLYIKKAYYDEPSFRDSKVIFSLYQEGFNSNLAPNFAEQVLFKEVTPEDVSMMKSPANYEELCKLAVAYSDGVIQNDETVNQNVLDYARSLNIPVLEYASGDAYADACDAFYDKVFVSE